MHRGGYRIYGPYREKRGWRVVITAADGSRASESYPEESEALDRVRQLRQKVEQEVWIDEALAGYRKHREAEGVTMSTVATDMHRLRILVEPHADSLERLTPRKAQRLYDRMRERGYSADYHRGALTVAKRFGRWCVEQGWCRRNPFGEVKPVGKKRRGKAQLTIDESRKLHATCLADPSPEATAVLCCLLLGLRASEVVQLEARDIDDGGRLLRVRRETTKTDAGERRLELTPELSDRLRALAPSGPLFPGKTRYWVLYHVKRLCRVAGVPEVTAHGLRGTHSTLATEAGAAAALVQAQLGHTDTETGRRHYYGEDTARAAQGRAALAVLQGGRR